MENLTKTQVILLVLLVSFITSFATGIVSVTLMDQAPPPLTQTINRVVEKTIEKVAPGILETPSPLVPQPMSASIASLEEAIADVAQRVSPAVVSVVATKDIPVIEQYYVNPFQNDPFFQQFFEGFGFEIPQYQQKGVEKKQIASGTGFFVSPDGLIITNRHVVEDRSADYSVILNDGRTLDAKVLARDPFQDIAILKVKADGFKFLSLGDSDKLKTGEFVIAIGNALGEFQNTVSFGIISGLNRSVTASSALSGEEELQGLIQTDSAINPGNSGGPLINLGGQVVGINTAMAQGAQNVGFALPINIAKRDIDDAKEFNEIKYPFMGVRYQMVTAKIKTEKNLPVDYGLLLTKGPNSEPAIVKNGPADKAGLREGDIILEFNGTKLINNNILASLLNKSRVNQKITLKILRGNQQLEVTLTLEARPENL
ncbi:MAG: trypsin-like peptidase domain-containing protein [Patescibacteria group bacterium]